MILSRCDGRSSGDRWFLAVDGGTALLIDACLTVDARLAQELIAEHTARGRNADACDQAEQHLFVHANPSDKDWAHFARWLPRRSVTLVTPTRTRNST